MKLFRFSPFSCLTRRAKYLEANCGSLRLCLPWEYTGVLERRGGGRLNWDKWSVCGFNLYTSRQDNAEEKCVKYFQQTINLILIIKIFFFFFSPQKMSIFVWADIFQSEFRWLFWRFNVLQWNRICELKNSEFKRSSICVCKSGKSLIFWIFVVQRRLY